MPGDEFSHANASFDLTSQTPVTFAYNYIKMDPNANSIDGVQVVYGYVYQQGQPWPITSFTNWDPNAADPTEESRQPGPEYRTVVLGPGHYTVSMTYIQGYITNNIVSWYNRVHVAQRKGGGLRIKSITSYTGDTKVLVKKYDYTSNGQTTGISIASAYYNYISTVAFPRLSGACTPVATYFGRSSSTNCSPSISFNGTAVGYSKVTESLGDNGEGGRTDFFFHNSEMGIAQNFAFPFVPGYLEAKNGKLSLAAIHDATGNVLKKTEYTYAVKNALEIKGIKTFRVPVPPQSDPNAGPYQMSYSIGIYPNASSWVVLSTEKETIFNNGQQVSTLTNYSYDNAEHLQVTKKTVARSNGKTLITKYKYPADYSGAGSSSFVAQMKLKNILASIEEQTLVQEGSTQKLIAGHFTEYQLFNGDYKPRVNYRLAAAGPLTDLTESTVSASGQITKHPNYREEVIFDGYNSLGGLTAFHKANDVNHTYLWGNNQTYPVAEVAGGDYTTINGLVNQTVLDNSQTTDGQMRAELNNLRNGLSGTDALVTTYTYKPLVGMTSQTAPTGKTTYYEYDAFGRLNFIRDKDGNIVKKYDYKYASQ